MMGLSMDLSWAPPRQSGFDTRQLHPKKVMRHPLAIQVGILPSISSEQILTGEVSHHFLYHGR